MSDTYGREECEAEAYYGERPGGVYVTCVLPPDHPTEERHLTVVNGQPLAWGGPRVDPVGPVTP